MKNNLNTKTPNSQIVVSNCYLIQNFQSQIDLIPSSLQNLPYGIYPDNPSYNNARLNYNKLLNYFPKAIFYPTSVEEISYLIKEFNTNKLKFAIRSGGHGYWQTSLSNDYVLDMTKLSKKCIINNDKKSVTLSAGLKLGEIIEALGKESLITTTGTAYCVGLAGLSLSGGKGLLTRSHGLASDNIVSAKMVNYAGNILSIDKDNNPDLFWAIRGAGAGNFGVITEITLKTYNDTWLQSSTLTWQWDKKTAAQLFKVYQSQILTYPKNVWAGFLMDYQNSSAFISVSIYVIGKKPIAKFVSPFQQIGEPTITVYSGNYSETYDKWGDIEKGESGCFSKVKSSIMLKPINDIGISNLVNDVEYFLQLKFKCQYQLNIHQFGGAVKRGGGCFAFKDAIGVISYFAQWSDATLTGKINTFMNDIYTNNRKFISPYCFFTLIDYNIPNHTDAYFGKNIKRLIEIKQKHDPHNMFKYKQSIPITY